MIAGLRCNYPKDGPGFFAGSRSDGFCRLRRNRAPLSLYAIVLKLHDTCDQVVWHVDGFNWGLDGITGDRRLIGLAMRNCIAASSQVGR